MLLACSTPERLSVSTEPVVEVVEKAETKS
jgi:hypothetical protein